MSSAARRALSTSFPLAIAAVVLVDTLMADPTHARHGLYLQLYGKKLLSLASFLGR